MTLLDMDHYNLPCGFGNGPEPPLLAGKPRVMTGDVDAHLFQDALSLQVSAVE